MNNYILNFEKFFALSISVGSLAVGTLFFLSPLASALTDWYGFRRVGITGSVVATLGMYLSSWAVDHSPTMLMLTFGLMFGGGSSFAYAPSVAIMVHYFKKRLGMATGFVACGAPVLTLAAPFLLKYLAGTYGVSTLV